MGYGSGVSPQRRLVSALVDQPHQWVKRGATVVGTLAAVSVLAFRFARITARRP